MKTNLDRREWRALRGPLKREWPELTDEELDQIDGDRERLVVAVMAQHHEPRERVEWRLDELMGRVLGTESLQDSETAHRQFRDETLDVAGSVDRPHPPHGKV